MDVAITAVLPTDAPILGAGSPGHVAHATTGTSIDVWPASKTTLGLITATTDGFAAITPIARSSAAGWSSDSRMVPVAPRARPRIVGVALRACSTWNVRSARAISTFAPLRADAITVITGEVAAAGTRTVRANGDADTAG